MFGDWAICVDFCGIYFRDPGTLGKFDKGKEKIWYQKIFLRTIKFLTYVIFITFNWNFPEILRSYRYKNNFGLVIVVRYIKGLSTEFSKELHRMYFCDRAIFLPLLGS